MNGLVEMIPPDQKREALLRTVESKALLDGRFEDIRRLGQSGGSGVWSLLFVASDRTTGERIALKFFNPAKDDPYRKECFEREADLLHSLGAQPDIIRCIAPRSHFLEVYISQLGLSLDVPFHFYAIELAESDLGRILDDGLWGAEEKLVAFRAICRGVQRLHMRRIVHRDLKPDNCLIFAPNIVKISDLGTAKLTDSQPIRPIYNVPPGDVRYAGPEILACLQDDEPAVAFRGDMFALGAILFECFTGIRLGVYLFTDSYRMQLMLAMTSIKRGSRQTTFDKIVSDISNAYPLPSIRNFSSDVPRCILPRLDGLYQSLAALDYRRRLTNFEELFWKLDGTLMVLRNEQAYRRLREMKERYRKLRAEKTERQKLFAHSMKGRQA